MGCSLLFAFDARNLNRFFNTRVDNNAPDLQRISPFRPMTFPVIITNSKGHFRTKPRVLLSSNLIHFFHFFLPLEEEGGGGGFGDKYLRLSSFNIIIYPFFSHLFSYLILSNFGTLSIWVALCVCFFFFFFYLTCIPLSFQNSKSKHLFNL